MREVIKKGRELNDHGHAYVEIQVHKELILSGANCPKKPEVASLLGMQVIFILGYWIDPQL